MPADIKDPSLPSYTRPEVIEVHDDLALVHDLLGGTRRMWNRSHIYIRKWADEDDKIYDIRRKIETLFEGLGRTLSAAVGMMFAKKPEMNWNRSEQAMIELWDNIDAMGTKGDVFVKRFADAATRDGIGVILVDHTTAPAGVEVTAANERALGLRPTWAAYPRSAVRSWRTAVVNNRTTLTQLVLYECGQEPAGAFGVRLLHRYRVLRLIDGVASWELWEQTEDDAIKEDQFRLVDAGTFRDRAGRNADFLPVAIAYTGRTDAPLTATIPLMGVAWANLAHWQSATDLRFYRALCAFPQPVLKGDLQRQAGVDAEGNAVAVPGKLRIGPAVVVHVGEEGDYRWVELEGKSLEQLERGVKEKLDQMSALGMSFLASDKRAAETAEGKRLDATAENSTLATAAQGIEDAVNLALEYTAWYLGIDKAGAPVTTLNKDYDSTAMDPETMKAYVAAVKDAGLPVRLLLEAWVAGGRLPADTDIDQLEMDMLAADQARRDEEAERARLEAEAQRGAAVA